MSLIDTIKGGEGKNAEFKAELPANTTLAKTIIAFSNTAGGKLIVGVDNHGKVVGLNPDVDMLELQDKVASIIYDSCHPNILPDIYATAIDGLVLLVIEVYRGNLLPYHLKRQGKTEGVFIRVGATNRQASSLNILELERQRMNTSFDQEVNRDTAFESLDVSSLSRRFEAKGKAFDQTVMKNLKLIVDNDGKISPTNGLLILLGKLEQVRMKCSRFKGITMDVFLDRKEYEGDLFSQLEYAENFIKNHISLGSEIKGLQREDEYELPIEAIREGLNNAVVHRDYSNDGRDIKIGVYDDMVNIVSPGAFPSTITQEDILEGRSEIRNKVVARVFKELDYIEQWGSGIRRIKSSCIARGLKEPEVVEKGDSVDVSLYRKIAGAGIVREHDGELTDQEASIIAFMKTHNSRIRMRDVKDILEVEERRAREILKALSDRGLIVRRSGGPSTFYELR